MLIYLNHLSIHVVKMGMSYRMVIYMQGMKIFKDSKLETDTEDINICLYHVIYDKQIENSLLNYI